MNHSDDFEVAHLGRNAVVRLGGAVDGKAVPVELHRREVHAFCQRPDEFVEDADDHRSVALQLLNHAHARQQLLALLTQIADLGDLLVQHGDLVLDELVAGVLLLYRIVQIPAACKHDQCTEQHRPAQADQEFVLASLTLPFAPRE